MLLQKNEASTVLKAQPKRERKFLFRPFFIMGSKWGYWISQEKGSFIPLRLHDKYSCNWGACNICAGKPYRKKDGSIGGGTMYLFKDMYSIDTRYLLCPKCAREHLFSLRGLSYKKGGTYTVFPFARDLSSIRKFS